jgi:hypothetical protein
MALIFPPNPTLGQTYQSGSSLTYQWNGSYWDIFSLSPTIDLEAISSTYASTASFSQDGGKLVAAITSSTPTPATKLGSLWWNNNEGNLYIQATTPTGSTYVPAVSTIISAVSASYAITSSYTPMFEWISAGTSSITGTITNPSKGTIVYDTVRYRKINPTTHEIEYNFAQSTVGGAGSGSYLWSLPPGITWGPGVETTTSTTYSVLVNRALNVKGNYLNSSIFALRVVGIVPYDSTRFVLLISDTDGDGFLGNSSSFPFNVDGTSYKFSFYNTI